jgi:hypothetical protein
VLHDGCFAPLQSERWADTSWLRLGALGIMAAAGWAALFAAKLALGFALKCAAVAYVDHYDAHAKARSASRPPWCLLSWLPCSGSFTSSSAVNSVASICRAAARLVGLVIVREDVTRSGWRHTEYVSAFCLIRKPLLPCRSGSAAKGAKTQQTAGQIGAPWRPKAE